MPYGEAGRVDSIVDSKKLLALPVKLPSETREVTLTLSAGKNWGGGLLKNQNSNTCPSQDCGSTCMQLFFWWSSLPRRLNSLCPKPHKPAWPRHIPALQFFPCLVGQIRCEPQPILSHTLASRKPLVCRLSCQLGTHAIPENPAGPGGSGDSSSWLTDSRC